MMGAETGFSSRQREREREREMHRCRCIYNGPLRPRSDPPQRMSLTTSRVLHPLHRSDPIPLPGKTRLYWRRPREPDPNPILCTDLARQPLVITTTLISICTSGGSCLPPIVAERFRGHPLRQAAAVRVAADMPIRGVSRQAGMRGLIYSCECPRRSATLACTCDQPTRPATAHGRWRSVEPRTGRSSPPRRRPPGAAAGDGAGRRRPAARC